MAITKLVRLPFKSDPVIRADASARFPGISDDIFAGIPENQAYLLGRIVEENGRETSRDFLRLLFLAWDKLESFHASYPDSAAFQDFKKEAIAFFSAPAKPILFKTDYCLTKCTSLPLTEVILLETASEGSAAEYQKLKAELGNTIPGEFEVIGGPGVEAETGSYLAMLGWKSIRARERALANDIFATVFKALSASGKVSSLLVEAGRF